MGGCLGAVLLGETVFLDWGDQRDLVSSQWPIGPKVWLFYRIITMMYIVGVLIWAFVTKFMRYQWVFFTFMSHWSYMIFTFNSILKAICAIKYYNWLKRKDLTKNEDEEKPLLSEHLPIVQRSQKGHWLLQFSWLVANIANAFSVYTTVGYWSSPPTNIVSEIVNIQIHGVNMILTVLDTILVAQPTLLLHIYQPICFDLLYISFTALYYAAGGLGKNGVTGIYPNLDWAQPEMTLSSYLPSGLISIIICYLMIWVLAVFRRLLAGVILKRNSVAKSQHV